MKRRDSYVEARSYLDGPRRVTRMPPACGRDCRQSPRFSPGPIAAPEGGTPGQARGVRARRPLWPSALFHEGRRQPSWCFRLPGLVFKKTGKELANKNQSGHFNDARRVRNAKPGAWPSGLESRARRARISGAGCLSFSLTRFLLRKIIRVAFGAWQTQAAGNK